MGILVILFILALIPIILMLVGLIMAFSSNKETSKRGSRYLGIGILILLVEVLIGYAVCSNMRFN